MAVIFTIPPARTRWHPPWWNPSNQNPSRRSTNNKAKRNEDELFVKRFQSLFWRFPRISCLSKTLHRLNATSTADFVPVPSDSRMFRTEWQGPRP
mmetsp:Transcript_9764/g.19895  ORF Transcript_9764/g.19895 Transcript_9764/m.19895 type:complete len:95 (-) Transcript_9764:255-539(-)